jgi:hypothetical protein
MTMTMTTTTPTTRMRQKAMFNASSFARTRASSSSRRAPFVRRAETSTSSPKSLKSSSEKSFFPTLENKENDECDFDEETRTKKCVRMATISASLSVLLAVSGPFAFVEPSLSSSSPLGVAHAGLNKKGNNNAYEEMMKQMEAENAKAGGGSMSAESLFKESGGACGPGYEMRVKLVTGAECECVQPELCTREGEMTAEERSYGKKPKPSEKSNGEGGGESKKEMMSSDGGIQFTFNN